MKVSNLRHGNGSGAARVNATVVWEDCDRLQKQSFVETSAEFADAVRSDPNAFFAGDRHAGATSLQAPCTGRGKLCP